MKKNVLILFCLLVINTSLFSQRHKFYNQIDGIPSTEIYDIGQDHNGIIWVSSYGGLMQIDGLDITVHQHNPKDSSSLNSNIPNTVFNHAGKQLWIGLNNQLQIYDDEHDRFLKYPIRFKNTEIFPGIHKIKEDDRHNIWLATSHGLLKINSVDSIQDFVGRKNSNEVVRNQINDLEIDGNEIWCATEEDGLQIFDISKNAFSEKRLISDEENPFKNNSILSLLKDREGNIIIGTLNKGLFIYHTKQNRLSHIGLLNGGEYTLTGGVLSIVEDQTGTIWIGTERNGLKILQVASNKLTDANLLINLENLQDSKITCYVDEDNNLWLGISHMGVYLMKANSKPFYTLRKGKGQLSHSNIKSILIDHKENLWIGTDGGGLDLLSPDHSVMASFRRNPNDSHSIPDNVIITMCEDGDDQLWTGAFIGGLSKYNPASANFVNYLMDTTAYGRNNNFVSAIIQDEPGKLLIGTTGGGLYLLDKRKNRITNMELIIAPTGKARFQKFIASLIKDKEGNLWVGSYNGLLYWNRGENSFTEFTKDNDKLKLGEAIYTLFEDRQGNIWAGSDGGLIQFNNDHQLVTIFTIEDGLCSNTIYSIEQDSFNNLWISTNNGLSKFNLKDKVFFNFYIQDGLPSNEFRPQASCRAPSGKLYFGTTDGLLFFDPKEIKISNDVPQLILKDMKINNSLVQVASGSKSILQHSINLTEHISLEYDQRNFSFEFTAVNYSAPEKIRYAYIMDGFDESWSVVDYRQRKANYTNLNPGDYVFRIKSTNSDGVWAANERTLSITIEPPFWKSNWAFAFYLAAALCMLYFFKRLILIRANFRHDLKVERLQRENVEKLSVSKLQFFTNISHEFRTPLTLILGPIQDLIDGKEREKEERDQLISINNNANRLLRLANQLLDFRKAESGNLKLSVSESNIVKFIQEVKLSFDPLATSLKINFSLTASSSMLNVWFDTYQFEKIMFNLLSNAFKNTAEGGRITLTIQDGEDEITIEVEDTGRGIKREHFENIFQTFFSYDEDKYQAGTGIGLALTKSLVDAHHGQLGFESEENVFTRFTIKLRKGYTHFDAVELSPVSSDVESMDHYPSLVSDPLVMQAEVEGENENPVGNYPSLLIVEDNTEVRKYIRSIFSLLYIITEASNGEEGIRLAKSIVPDIVISDVMMPGTDGITLCSQLKSDITTSHIPVILLTARTSLLFKVEGLETGADDYITKPFNPNLLKLKVRNLVHTRDAMKRMFNGSKVLTIEPSKVTVTSVDEIFLKQALQSVEQNMGNPDYGVDEICRDVGMSRSQLYKKLKALTGQSANEFIRTLRLKRAAQLLEQNQFTIAEVTNWVGFTDLQYFRDCFKKLFGVIPSEFVKTSQSSRQENSEIG